MFQFSQSSLFPNISIFGQVGKGIFGDDPEYRMYSIMRSTGVGKVPQFVMDVAEDYGWYSVKAYSLQFVPIQNFAEATALDAGNSPAWSI